MNDNKKISSPFNTELMKKSVNNVGANKGVIKAEERIMATDSTNRKLEIPQYVPIYDDTLTPDVPYSVELSANSEIVIPFQIPKGTQKMVVTGWYSILCLRREINTNPNNVQRLFFVNPDQQNELQDASAITLPPTVPYNLLLGLQAGNLIKYGWQFSNYPIGSWHHAHHNFHYRLFPVPMELPAGHQGKLTIQRSAALTRYFDFFPSTKLYLYVGLVGKRAMDFPPPFQFSATLEPVSQKAYSTDTLTVPRTVLGQLGQTTPERIQLTGTYPHILDDLIFTGELDGLYFKMNWYNGMLSLDWLPACLFQFRHSGGRLPSQILLAGDTAIDFLFAEGIRLTANSADKNRQFAVDVAGGTFGF